ncbi:hypothetical protein TrVFT333_011815 [Trichoderma virens FT-333]|nr:hypothetical protein TrVFT333_011815 [Trichoderma virens FT-333]
MSTKIAYEETTHSQPDSQEENESARTTLRLSDRSADESYKLFSKVQVSDPTPEEARRIRNKCLWRILPFLFITGVITIIFGGLVYLFYPDSPLHANFLTYEERAQAILRIKDNNSGIEQKQFKKHQFVEAMKDPKTWLFALHAWSQEMGNGINNQTSLIINSFGFTVFQTTLLSTVSGVIAFFTLSAAAIALHKTRNSRAWISLIAYVPAVISTLPWSNRWGLIVGVWLRYTTGVPYAILLLSTISDMDWEILFPPTFEPRWKPRYKPTWIILLIVAAILPSIIIIILRIYLSRENKRRDKLEADNIVTSNGLVETTNADGTKEVRVVDTNQLDLTDRENLKFRYVL